MSKMGAAVVCMVIVCMVIAASVILPQLVSAEWSMFRSDASHSGVGTDNLWGNRVLTPTQLWKTNISFPELAETNILGRVRELTDPTVVDGIVYLGAHSFAILNVYGSPTIDWIDVYAFNASNGAAIWDYRDNGYRITTPPAVVNGVVYFATERYICALHASDGSLLWKYSAGTFVSYPAVADGMVFIGSGEGSKGTLLAINANNGHGIWSFTNHANSRTFGSPAVANGVVYVGSFDENMYALDAVTGHKIWNYHAGDFHATPAVAVIRSATWREHQGLIHSKGVVYAITSGANIYAFDAISGTRIWNYSIYDGWVTGGPCFAIMNNVVYARNGQDKLYALNAISGAKIWNFTFGQFISAPTVVNDVVYVGSDRALYALNAHNGDMLWNYTKSDGFGSPVVVDGVAYVVGDFYGGEDNQLYAIAVPSSLLTPSVLPVVAVVTVVAVVCVGLQFYFKKRKH